MREIFIDKNDPYFNRPKAFYILVFSVFVFGGLIAYLFIPTERKIVEVPVEKVKYVDRVVEKKVEVPVEKIQYVDRVVEKKVEVPVEVVKYIKVPSEKDNFENQEGNSNPKYIINWRNLEKGMSRDTVRFILGIPNNMSCDSHHIFWYYGAPPNDRAVAFPLNYDEGVVDWFIRN